MGVNALFYGSVFINQQFTLISFLQGKFGNFFFLLFVAEIADVQALRLHVQSIKIKKRYSIKKI
jgi:hypothetical protein